MSYLEQLEKFIEKQKNEEPETRGFDIGGISRMTLSELEKRNIAIELYSEILGCNVWLCGNDEMATQVKTDNPHAVTYTVSELRELIQLSPKPEELQRIHNAKSVFAGSEVIDNLKVEA